MGTDLGILLTAAFPNFSIGPLAALLRAFRIGRILRLVSSLSILIFDIAEREEVFVDAHRYHLLHIPDPFEHRCFHVIKSLQ
jgi:hypothetical protein